MKTLKAVYYGQLELIPGIMCDVYVLSDGIPVMSLRGTADLLSIDHKSLRSMGAKWPPKALKPFVDKGWSMGAEMVEVVAENSPYKGRKIVLSIVSNLVKLNKYSYLYDGYFRLRLLSI
jgi:hypothetical protein